MRRCLTSEDSISPPSPWRISWFCRQTTNILLGWAQEGSLFSVRGDLYGSSGGALGSNNPFTGKIEEDDWPSSRFFNTLGLENSLGITSGPILPSLSPSTSIIGGLTRGGPKSRRNSGKKSGKNPRRTFGINRNGPRRHKLAGSAHRKALKEHFKAISLKDCYQYSVLLVVCNKLLNRVQSLITEVTNDKTSQFDEKFANAFFKRVTIRMKEKLAGANLHEAMAFLAAINSRVRDWAFRVEYKCESFDSKVSWSAPGSEPLYGAPSGLNATLGKSIDEFFNKEAKKEALECPKKSFWKDKKNKKYAPPEYDIKQKECLQPQLKPELQFGSVILDKETWLAVVKERLEDIACVYTTGTKAKSKLKEMADSYTKLKKASENLPRFVTAALNLLQTFFSACQEEFDKLENSISPLRWKARLINHLKLNFESVSKMFPANTMATTLNLSIDTNLDKVYDREFYICLSELIYEEIRKSKGITKDGKISGDAFKLALEKVSNQRISSWKISTGMDYQKALSDLLKNQNNNKDDDNKKASTVEADCLSDDRLVPTYKFIGGGSKVLILPHPVKDMKPSGSELDLACLFVNPDETGTDSADEDSESMSNSNSNSSGSAKSGVSEAASAA